MRNCQYHPFVDMRPSTQASGGRGVWYECPICESQVEWDEQRGRIISRYWGGETRTRLEDLIHTEPRNV